jgi:hypothetical protein
VEAEYNKIAANRPGSIAVYGAVGARDGETTMSVIDIPGWSGDGQSMHDKRRPENARTMTVPMHRLETILERAGITHVNYSMYQSWQWHSRVPQQLGVLS